MKVRIYKPSKTAMQSGTAKTQEWLLEFEPSARQAVEPLMGWNAQTDTSSQMELWFCSEEEAVAYAAKHRLAYEVTRPKTRKIKPKAYADNFKFDKIA